MADRYYGLNRGLTKKDVTESSSTTSLDVEVRFEILSGMSKNELVEAIQHIMGAILEDTWPPA